ncbi:hypothetical protein ACP70R_000914 [Stipagrostis hirtigluma subsp. patula]
MMGVMLPFGEASSVSMVWSCRSDLCVQSFAFGDSKLEAATA